MTDRERGAALLTAILVAGALSAALSSLALAGLGAAAEVAAAREVACARFTALGALNLAMQLPGPAISAKLFPGASSIQTSVGWTTHGLCRVTVLATCGQARRSISRQAPSQRCLQN